MLWREQFDVCKLGAERWFQTFGSMSWQTLFQPSSRSSTHDLTVISRLRVYLNVVENISACSGRSSRIAFSRCKGYNRHLNELREAHFMMARGTIYFGYGSNLWKHQMLKRCPTSAYLGIARLSGYQWIINDRGYANIVEDSNEIHTSPNHVWGLVYSLYKDDEKSLDRNEGVPVAYTKEILDVAFWPAQSDGPPKVDENPEVVEMLVYIDRKRIEPDKPKKEYIYRMNMGMQDAMREGMPSTYVDNVLRKFIPDVEDDTDEKLAHQQAVAFEDE